MTSIFNLSSLQVQTFFSFAGDKHKLNLSESQAVFSLPYRSSATIEILESELSWWLSVMDDNVCSFTAISFLWCPADSTTNLFMSVNWADTSPKTQGKQIWAVTRCHFKSHFSVHNFILTDVQLNITSDPSIIGMKSHNLFWLSFPQPRKHMVCRNRPNVCKRGQLPCCSQTLMPPNPAYSPL